MLSARASRCWRGSLRDRFIDDGRYAEAFVRDKLRLSGWGEYKIRTALQRKRIDRELIDAALAQADRQDMAGRLRQQGIEISKVLEQNDSYHALERVDGLIFTGSTGTNVNDVAVLLCR